MRGSGRTSPKVRESPFWAPITNTNCVSTPKVSLRVTVWASDGPALLTITSEAMFDPAPARS
jgi:hypothetical protein